MKLTQERAKEIIQQAKNKTKYGPWSDQLSKVMTKEERDEVNSYWSTMDSSTCFVDALYQFVNGKAYT